MRSMRSPLIGVVAATTVLAPVGLAVSAAATTTPDVAVEWTIDQDWGTGFQGSVRVVNNSGHAIDPWSVTVPYGNTIGSAWDTAMT